jgi:hypothetical protein
MFTIDSDNPTNNVSPYFYVHEHRESDWQHRESDWQHHDKKIWFDPDTDHAFFATDKGPRKDIHLEIWFFDTFSSAERIQMVAIVTSHFIVCKDWDVLIHPTPSYMSDRCLPTYQYVTEPGVCPFVSQKSGTLFEEFCFEKDTPLVHMIFVLHDMQKHPLVPKFQFVWLEVCCQCIYVIHGNAIVFDVWTKKFWWLLFSDDSPINIPQFQKVTVSVAGWCLFHGTLNTKAPFPCYGAHPHSEYACTKEPIPYSKAHLHSEYAIMPWIKYDPIFD